MEKYNVLKSNQKWQKKQGLNLDDMLEEVTVANCDEMVDDFEEGERTHQINSVLSGWYAVVDTDGINAYFSTETEALAYRLFLINRTLNG